MEGEEGISNATVNCDLEPLLPGDWARVAQVRAPPTGSRRAQALARGRVVQVSILTERDGLVRRVLNCRVIGRLPSRAVEAQIAQVDASKVSNPPVLGQQERSGRF